MTAIYINNDFIFLFSITRWIRFFFLETPLVLGVMRLKFDAHLC